MESLEQLKARDNLSAVRQVVPQLKAASETGLLYFAKLPEPLPRKGRVYEYRHEPVDLLKALRNVFSRGVHPPEEEERLSAAIPRRIVYSVRSKSREILERLHFDGFGQCDHSGIAMYYEKLSGDSIKHE